MHLTAASGPIAEYGEHQKIQLMAIGGLQDNGRNATPRSKRIGRLLDISDREGITKQTRSCQQLRKIRKSLDHRATCLVRIAANVEL